MRDLDDHVSASRPDYAELLRLEDVSWAGPELEIRWTVDALRFVTTLWYDGVDFDQLVERFGREAIERIAFHIALFEVNKGVSFGPSRFEIADPWSRFLTPDLLALWRNVVIRVWAQWRYQHQLPDYEGPEAPAPTTIASPSPLHLPATTVDTLWFCGGGKDSLLAAHLLDALGERYDALAYAHSIYGRSGPQLRLIGRLLDGTKAIDRRHIYMYDTSTDLPLSSVSPYSEVEEVLAAETPASLFATLPIALTHGYRWLVLAHERSANVGNLIWSATGEDVNHQWGKSLEAERLLDDYVRTNLISEIRYFSVLQPVHDALIFGSLREVAASIPLAHSCNIEKPWCKRCPKCAYVWICYKAWLPWDVVDATFDGSNLLDMPENQVWFRQMLGLEEHTPFECIGQIDETRLAFAMARARGLTGVAMTLLDEVVGFDPSSVLDRYLAVDRVNHRIPDELASSVVRFFDERAASSRRFAEEVLGL